MRPELSRTIHSRIKSNFPQPDFWPERRLLLCVADYEAICFGSAAMVPNHFRE